MRSARTNLLTGLLAVAIYAAGATAAPLFDSLPGAPRSLEKVSQKLAQTGAGRRDGKGPMLDVRLNELDRPILERLIAAGLDLTDADFQHARVYGRCTDLRCLSEVASLPEVTFIHPLYGAATSTGKVTSQGDAAIGAAEARQRFALSGDSVRIGLLSDTFTDNLGDGDGTFAGEGCSRTYTPSRPALVAELPAQINVIAEPEDFDEISSFGGIDEGRAMAEIVHDLAPGAEILFHTAFNTPSIFAQGIDALVECGADIIADDVIYFVEPMFQDGIIAQAATRAVDSGVTFFSAIGNLGTWGVDETYLDFAAADDRASQPSGDDMHVFANGSRFASVTVPGGCGLLMVLQWNEPFSGTLGPGASSDLDFYACDEADVGGCDSGISSRDTQGCSRFDGGPGGDPVEILELFAFEPTIYHIAVEHACGNEDLRLRIVSFATGCFFPDEYVFDEAVYDDPQIYGHPVATGVIGTAAVFYQEIESNGANQPPAGVINVEPFSSLGGDIPFYFDPSGTPLAESPQARPAPQVSGPDGTSTTFFSPRFDVEEDGIPNFFGTSAAAPHIAAVAALMREADPSLSSAETLEILQSTSIDIESPGSDARSGSGLVDVVSAVEEIFVRQTPTATASASPTATATPTATVSCAGDCDRNGRVDIGELIAAVRIVLQLEVLATCPAADRDASGTVGINEIVLAVRSALQGC